MIKFCFLIATATPLVLTQAAIVCSQYEKSEMEDAPVCTKQLWLGDPVCNCDEVKSENDECNVTTEMIQNLQNSASVLEQSNFKAEQRISELEENLRKFESLTIITAARTLYTSSCDNLYELGVEQDGVYSIVLGGRLVEVYCEFQRDGRNWLVFQRRFSGKVDFYLNWIDYQNRFGEKTGEFWLGLDNLLEILSTGTYKLRVDLEDWKGNTAYAEYSHFTIDDSNTNYRLTVGGYRGNAGDSLAYHNNSPFSTKDQDNDISAGHCSTRNKGAWRYGAGHSSNLNGMYLHDGQSNQIGVVWRRWKGSFLSLRRSEMKIRPVSLATTD